jgi:hypothetical protein
VRLAAHGRAEAQKNNIPFKRLNHHITNQLQYLYFSSRIKILWNIFYNLPASFKVL